MDVKWIHSISTDTASEHLQGRHVGSFLLVVTKPLFYASRVRKTRFINKRHFLRIASKARHKHTRRLWCMQFVIVLPLPFPVGRLTKLKRSEIISKAKQKIPGL